MVMDSTTLVLTYKIIPHVLCLSGHNVLRKNYLTHLQPYLKYQKLWIRVLNNKQKYINNPVKKLQVTFENSRDNSGSNKGKE